jgi:hypothetical protein
MSKERYKAAQGTDFPSTFIFEKTRKGVLVTEIDERRGVLDQEYFKNSTIDALMKEKLGTEAQIERVERLERTVLALQCKTCGTKLVRELEFLEPIAIEDVPVVPIFRCTSCDKRFYSVTRTYLEHMVDRNNTMFEEQERSVLNDNRESFVNLLNEYIIRIFASKKISRIEMQE